MTPSEPLDANLGSSLLLTDLYQLNMLQAYRHKIQEYDGKPKRKRSEGKATWPGRKQVIRRYGADGTMVGDLLALQGELAEGEAPIRPVMRQGRRLDLRLLEDSRRRAGRNWSACPRTCGVSRGDRRTERDVGSAAGAGAGDRPYRDGPALRRATAIKRQPVPPRSLRERMARGQRVRSGGVPAAS